MMYNKFFTNFPNLPDLPEHIIQEGLNAEFKLISSPSRLYVAQTTFGDTDYYKKLQNTLGYIETSFRYSPPMSCYDWHIDRRRTCGILWPLKNNSDSSTLFREVSKNDVQDGTTEGAVNGKNIFFDLIEADYITNRPTLLNTEYEHCVINKSKEPRIILAVSIFNVSYEDAIKLLQNIK